MGAVVIRNGSAVESAWRWDLCPQIPAGAEVSVSIKIKTCGVSGGKGAFLRLQRGSFEWRPKPGFIFPALVETRPVTGDSTGWIHAGPIAVRSPASPGDELLFLYLVLDGQGEARFSALDVRLLETGLLSKQEA